MSLILEALRKLEREKQTPERSLIVTGAAEWAGPERHTGRPAGWAVGVALLVLVAGAVAWLWRPGRAAPTPSPALQASVPDDARALSQAHGERQPQAPSPIAPAALGAAPPERPSVTTARTATGAAAPPRIKERPEPAPSPAPAAASATPDDDDARPVAPADVVLQAIGERDGERVAILNGRLVRAGDSFAGVRVLRIGPSEVEIESQGQTRVVGF